MSVAEQIANDLAGMGAPREGGAEPAVTPEPAAAPPSTPPADAPKADAEPAIPEKVTFGDEERKSVRDAARLARTVANLQAQLRERDEQIAKARTAQPPSGEADTDEDGLVNYHGLRVTPEYARREAVRDQELAELRGTVNQLTQADLSAEQEQHQEEQKSKLLSLCDASRSQLIPSLTGDAAQLANDDMRRAFAELWDARLEDNSEAAFPSEDELAGILTQAGEQTKRKLMAYGYQQLAANRKAAAGQPPALGGAAASPGPKAYADMTPEERERAKQDEMTRIIREHVTFND